MAGTLSIKITSNINGSIQEKTMRFSADTAVWEACKEISEKMNGGGADHGLFQAGSQSRKPRWLKSNVTFKGLDILSGVCHCLRY